MTNFPGFTIFSVWILLLNPTGVCSRSGFESGGKRKVHEYTCREDAEYRNGNICCLNCAAGTHLTSPCTIAGLKGKCEECDYGSYTEYDNHLKQCLECRPCRSDQELVSPCTHTQDAVCQCKPGSFCDPDQACEVCKKCSKCKVDEEIVRNCTLTSNRVCKKIQSKSDSESANASVILLLSLLAVAVVLIVVFAVWMYRRRRAADSQRNPPDSLKAEQHCSDNCPTDDVRNGDLRRLSCSSLPLSRQLVRPKSSIHVEDERKVLCESLNSSASNSQHSLTSPPSYAFCAPLPRSSPAASRRDDRRPGAAAPQKRGRCKNSFLMHFTLKEDEPFPKLVAVNGEESLRRCFEYLEEIDIDYHKRFFRHLGIADNVIKSKEHLPYEDKLHELLNIWMEKVGRDSSLNDLLNALLALNQRRTAENIKEHAVHNGHYFSQN